MDDKAKAFKAATKKTTKKQAISMKKPGAILPKAGPSIKPKGFGPSAKAPVFKKSPRGR